MANKKIILIPIDFSEQAIIALDQAVNLAKEMKAKITLVNVIEDYGLFNKYISKKEQSDIKNKIDSRLKKIAEEKLEDMNTDNIESAMKIVEGTARSMGIKVE